MFPAEYTIGAPRPHPWHAIVRPSVHQRTALFERIAAPVHALRGVADDMGERGFGDLAREMRLVSRPVAKRGPETVYGHGVEMHAPENHFHRHDRKRPTGAGAGKYEIA